LQENATSRINQGRESSTAASQSPRAFHASRLGPAALPTRESLRRVSKATSSARRSSPIA
jgi:hypothetical protein